MSGDYSRDTFDALKDFAGVYLQQGRALLDADFNELGAILERRIRAGTVDTIGRCVVPRETEDGFAIGLSGGDMTVGTGRMYLGGVLLQNPGPANFDGSRPDLPDPVFDRGTFVDGQALGVLDEMTAPPDADPLNYLDQPYWPTPEDLPGSDGAHLAYVVAWQREVTPVKDPRLLEPAMGGIDTCTRWQTVWQVRMLADVGDNATCDTPDADLGDWVETSAPSTARLTTATIEVDEPEDPCLVPPTDGYTGLENQLYRVELHATEPGEPPTAFKFSRENASVAARVDAIGAGNDRVTVTRIGRDEVLRFSPGDWVELTDNRREFNHRSGQMLQVDTVNPDTREIVFQPGSAIDGDLIPGGGDDTLETRATRLIRWDQRGIIRRADDLSEWENVADSIDGLIPIPPDGVALLLESGITVAFSTADGPGAFRDMDYWCFAARTAGTQIEELRAAPPKGIQRHYCRLAIVRFPDSVLDCRVFWPPEFEGDGEAESCGCTVCVTAEGHNSGALTIQAAIDQVEAAGGTVCLEAGNYVLTNPVAIRDRTAIRVVGQGLGTVLFREGSPAIEVESSFDVKLDRFTVLTTGSDDGDNNPQTPHGIAARNTGFLALHRLAVLVIEGAPTDSFAFGVALDELQIATTVEDCLILAPYAVGAQVSFDIDVDDLPDFVTFLELRVRDCLLFGARDAVHFDLVAMNLAEAVFADNAVLGAQTGLHLRMLEIPGAATRVEGSTVIGGGDAIRLGCQDGRVTDCQLSGGQQAGDGVRLIRSQLPELPTEAQIVGNAILDCGGAGVRLAGLHESVLVKRNVVRRCGFGGVVTDPDAEVAHIAVDNNVIEDVGASVGAAQAGGVVILSAQDAMVVGNSIRRIGEGGQDGGRYAGVAAQDVRSLRIAGNTIDAIGPNRTAAEAAAIFVRQPYDDVIVSENLIHGTIGNEADSLGDWHALDIGGGRPRFTGGVTLGPEILAASAAVPVDAPETTLAFLRLDDEVLRIGAENLRARASIRAGQVGVNGTQVRALGRIFQPVVQAFDVGIASLSFAQNQITHQGGGGPPAVVELGAVRMSVNGNTVQHQSDSLSIDMVTGEQGAATPLGNITSGRILLNDGPVPPPFDALNLLA